MSKINYDILNNYWGLIETLNVSHKLDLIERLTNSIHQYQKQETNTMNLAFGAWESESSAEEIIEELRNSRSINRQIESL